jgi:hypothetical protein
MAVSANNKIVATDISASLGKNSRFSTIVIGTSTRGHNLSQVDYLCDGNADQVEIQAAINSIVNGRILILDGDYVFTGSVAFNKSYVKIEGQSLGTRIFANGTIAFNISDIHGAWIENLWFIGGNYSIDMITVKNSSYCFFSKLVFTDKYSTGIYMNNSWFNRIENCWFREFNCAIMVVLGQDNSITHCLIDGYQTDENKASNIFGIIVFISYNLRISQNSITLHKNMAISINMVCLVIESYYSRHKNLTNTNLDHCRDIVVENNFFTFNYNISTFPSSYTTTTLILIEGFSSDKRFTFNIQCNFNTLRLYSNVTPIAKNKNLNIFYFIDAGSTAAIGNRFIPSAGGLDAWVNNGGRIDSSRWQQYLNYAED